MQIRPLTGRRTRGFTLVELLIAFSLVSLIALLLFSGLRLGLRSWEGVENTAEANAELRVARDFLARVLTQTRGVTLELDAETVSVFSGDAESLEFVAPLSEYVGIPGLYILRVSVDGREPRRLVLTRWLLHPDVLEGTADVPEWEPYDGGIGASIEGDEDRDIAAGVFGTTVLVEGVDEFRIDYFEPADDDDLAGSVETIDGEWREDWFESNVPPLAVRIQLTTQDRSWPAMLVTLPTYGR